MRTFPAQTSLLLAAALLVASASISAQDQQPASSSSPQPPRVTTTVVVHAEAKQSYSTATAPFTALDGATLAETPLSAAVVTRAVLNDQGARLLSDVIKNDASVGEDYAPVGYYGVFEIRGFPIDLASALQINGMTIAGEQDVPLENKERVEILKGVAGIESGVASAGGLFNFVTKRPALVTAFDLATDHRGSSYGAADLGRYFGRARQLGLRANFAGEQMQSYVDHANGWRWMGSTAADYKLSSRALLKGDFEFQHKVQGSECGYQLLGGDQLPDLSRIYPSTMLGYQSWVKPNTFDALNSSARLDYDLPHQWRAFAQASYSRSLIDDNVIYVYGNYNYDPYYFFGPDGSYSISDYRNPGELRKNRVAEAIAAGRLKTGPVTHELAFGGELFARSVEQPKHSANSYLGEENIYQPIVAYDQDSALPGQRALDDDNHQAALIVQDRIHLPGRVQLVAGGRQDWMRDNFSVNPRRSVWLPNYAVLYSPVDRLTLYGNYAVMLSLGPQAPWWAANPSQYLDAYLTRQAEAGAKYEASSNLLLTVALFRMRAPYFALTPISAPVGDCTELDYAQNFCFEAKGHETHTGLEFNAQGRATNWLQLTASLTALSATSSETGTPAYDGKQVLNAPRLRSSFFADIVAPRIRGLHLMPGWSFAGRKAATYDDSVSAASVNLLNFGARYTPGGEQGRITYRLYADNILDKKYWKDTGANYGDTFLHLGAPTTVRLSMHYAF
jgi:iron complex outermembrane receptor protein